MILDRHLFIYHITNGVFQTRVHLTCSPLSPRLSGVAFMAVSHSPGFLAITALVTLLRWVSPPHWCSPSQRSRSVAFGRKCSTALVQPCRFTPQLFFRLGSYSLLLHFKPASRGCSSDGALVALLRPVVSYPLTLP